MTHSATAARVSLVCSVASSVPGAAEAFETPGHPAPLNLDIHQSMQVADPLTVQFQGYSTSVVRAAADHERERSRSGYRWDGSPASSPGWWGIKRDTLYFLGYQFVAIGLLYVAPEDISGWSEEQKDTYSFDEWKDNVRNPVLDEDKWWINYILHPYWGGAYYIRARERGFDRAQSFLYSALLSTLFEFGVEAMFEAPSYQDLIVTPVIGYLVGEYLFVPIRERIRAKPGEPGWGGKIVLFLTDPLGVVSAATDRIFGVKAQFSFQPIASAVALDPLASPHEEHYLQHGEFRTGNSSPVWGLQLRVAW